MVDGSARTASTPERLGLPVAELIALIASLMAVNALAIDIMLPAMPHIGSDLAVTDPNDRQYVVTAYLFGLGLAQLVFGPVSDRLGRRRPLLVSLVGYAVFAMACALAPSFELLVAFRALQGVAASGARTIALSVVRDVYAGRAMARLMSLVMMVFMIVPIVAPNLGAAVLHAADWPWIFGVLVVVGLALTIWVAARLPETLPPARRKRLDTTGLVGVYAKVLGTRTTVGYTLATGAVFGGLIAYLGSAEQIFSDVFGKRESFPLYFAAIAAAMAVSSLLNARLVSRLGMRRLAHGALVAFVAAAGSHLALLAAGYDGFPLFFGCLTALFFCFSFIAANFNALAMEPLGEIAGTASAFVGFTSTLLATTLGTLVGQSFDGTVIPLIGGFFVLGLVALVLVLSTERGRLFVPAPPPADERA